MDVGGRRRVPEELVGRERGDGAGGEEPARDPSDPLAMSGIYAH